jgi:hypothetical protein
MKKIVLVFAFSLITSVGFAQEKASREDVSKVIEKSGALAQMDAAKSQILAMIPKEKQPGFLIEFDVITKKVSDKTIDIYLAEFTKEDIKAMLDFYNSPVGKKIADKTPAIAEKSQESMVELQAEVQAMVMKYMQ